METQLHFQLIQSAHKTKQGSNKRTFPKDEKWQKLYMIKKKYCSILALFKSNHSLVVCQKLTKGP